MDMGLQQSNAELSLSEGIVLLWWGGDVVMGDI